jgi:hypothetical protein
VIAGGGNAPLCAFFVCLLRRLKLSGNKGGDYSGTAPEKVPENVAET